MKTSVIKFGPEMFEKDGRSVREDIESIPLSFDAIQKPRNDKKGACKTAQQSQAQSDSDIRRNQTFKGRMNLSRVGKRFLSLPFVLFARFFSLSSESTCLSLCWQPCDACQNEKFDGIRLP